MSEVKTIENAINNIINTGKEKNILDSKLISDGYHTFGELYEHRIDLFIALCKQIHWSYQRTKGLTIDESFPIWKSVKHSDGSMYDRMFILGIFTEKNKQITYHLPIEKWDDTNFATAIDNAPEYDGHTSNDVLERLKQL